MTRVLVLGGSFAGYETADTLRRLAGHRVQVTVIDRSQRFEFRPSLPWVVFGQRRPQDTWVPRPTVLEKARASFVHDHIEKIDAKNNTVYTRGGRHEYDFLVIALGGTSPTPGPAGFAGHGYAPLWLNEGIRLRQALSRFDGGPVVLAFHPRSPLACAMYEFVFQMDAFLRQRGLRRRSPVAFVTYEKQPYEIGGAKASKIMQKWLAETNIRFFPETFVEHTSERHVKLGDGPIIRSDLFIYVPPYRGSPVVQDVHGLTDADGFVLTDGTMRSHAYPNVFAAGDCVSLPGPKTGLMAEQQARVAAANIAADLGIGQPTEYSSALGCILDLGPGRGLLTVRRPAPRQGPVRTYAVLPGVIPRLGKIAFEKYFMHVRLGKPLLPTRSRKPVLAGQR